MSIPTTAVMLLAASGIQCSLAAIAWDLHDIVAASGAFLAAAIALLEAKDKGRPLRYQISVLLSSIAIGSTVPGAVVSFYWPEKFQNARLARVGAGRLRRRPLRLERGLWRPPGCPAQGAGSHRPGR